MDGLQGMAFLLLARTHDVNGEGRECFSGIIALLWLQMGNVNMEYRASLAISGIMTAIATSTTFVSSTRESASTVTKWKDGNTTSDYEVTLCGSPFNHAYRYVDGIDWIVFSVVYLNGFELNKKYRNVLELSGIVTAISTYHCFRIFNSWECFHCNQVEGWKCHR